MSSHPVQHQADCLHKAGQMPLHRSPMASAWIPVMLVYLLTQLQATISHLFSSWKIILCYSCARVSMWIHFSEWKIILFKYRKRFLKVSFLMQGWSHGSEQRRKNWKDCSGKRKVAWPGRPAWICSDLSDRNWRLTNLKGFWDGAVGNARESTSCDPYGQPQELQEKHLHQV